jgi:simple sugar transport system ATP-binding protein
MRQFGILAPGSHTAARRLSGGNAQKIILAREFSQSTCVLLANQPTRGLDVGVIEYVHQQLLEKRAQGYGILLASEELDDLLMLCDRIAVMFKGRLMAVLDAASATRHDLGLLMAGQRLA